MESNETTNNEFLVLIYWHTINIYVGAIGTVICLFTLAIFLSSKKLFNSNKVKFLGKINLIIYKNYIKYIY